MKKFTVKDFIDYNGPCFSCSRPINFQIGFMDLESRRDMSYLRPVVTNERTEIDLKISYSNSLKLHIAHKTNRFQCNDMAAFANYLMNHKLFLNSTCDHCMTTIESQFLEFNPKGFVEAVGLAREHLLIQEDSKIHIISSSFLDEKSILQVTSTDRVKPLSPFYMELPLLPLSKLKTRERMLEKINTYLIFS